MSDFRARQRVALHNGTEEKGFDATKPFIVQISDGTETALINASGELAVEIKNTSISVDDGGSSISIDDGDSSITVDGSVTVSASDLDIRDLDAAQDDILIYANTAKDGSGTNYVPLVDTDGHLQIDILTGGGGEELADDSAFTVATSKVKMAGFLVDETTPDSVDEGDAGAARMTPDRKQLMVLVDPTTDSQRAGIDASGNLQIDLAALSLTALPVSKDSNANSETNPIFVQVVTGAVIGTEVHDYDTAASVAKDATDNHDYTVTGAKTLKLKKIIVSASGALKAEIQVGAIASLATVAVVFTSAANPTAIVTFDPPIEVPDTDTGTVRVIRRNDDNSAMDVYSTIMGNEV